MSNKGKSRILPGILGLIFVVLAVGEIQGQTRSDLDLFRRNLTITPENIQVLQAYVTTRFRSMENATMVTGLNKPLIELEEITAGTSSPAYLDEFARIIQENYGRLHENGVALSQQDSPELKELGENKRLAAAITLAISGHSLLIGDMKSLLDDESAKVRAWAVKGFSRDTMREYLNKVDGAIDLAGILSSLDVRLTTETSAEVIMHVAAAASMVDNIQSVTLLKKCVTRRVGMYESWEVDRELADLEILKLVFKVATQKSTNDRQGATDLLRSATKLYTAAYHRYQVGKTFRTTDNKLVPLLTEKNQHALRSLLIAGEVEFLTICGRSTTNNATRVVFMAMQDTNESKLPDNFISLMGQSGIVQQVFSIYNGWTAPGELPPPPPEIVKKAEILQKIKANTIKGS